MENKICVYAICKNESKFVEKWLDNMSEADYICVLDTGSTDDTVAKLQADPRVTRVEQQIITPWRFDVARNESMKLCPEDANILVCTDFDELFEVGWAEQVKRAWSMLPNTTRVFYKYAWSHNEVGEPTDVFTYDKIHTRDYHWVFPVHEVLMAIDNNFTEVSVDAQATVQLHHFQDKSKGRTYYFDLLQLACEENPEDSHTQMLYAREHLLRGDYEGALREYLKTLRMPDIEAPEKRLVLLESLGRAADCYAELENYDEAIWYCQEFIKEDPTYREPYFIMANLYNKMKMYTLAVGCVEMALRYSTRKNTWVERADTWVSEANDILSVSYHNLKEYDKALANVQEALKHHPEDIRILKNYNAMLSAKLLESKNKVKELESKLH